jgi:iron complex outermembrane recepter protein
MTGILVRIRVAAALLAAVSAGTVVAQTAEKGAGPAGLEEVVVTATRREERLQDVPISVSAFSQEKLDSQGLKNIDDLSRLAPGITFMRNGMGSSANYNDENSDINIRGVDSTAGTSTTGIYIDDTPVQSRHIGFGAVTIFPALFDLDRVEVLRGPQGTLFGAGAEGGVVRFITPAPSMVGSTGYARAEVATTTHGDPSYEFGAAMGTALIDNVLGLRVSASIRRDGGWVDRVGYSLSDPTVTLPTVAYANTTEKAANWQQTTTFRVALKWQPTDSVTVSPSLYYQRLQINDTAAYWLTLSNPSSGVYRNGNALTNPSTDPYWLGALKVDWDVGFAQLVSNTSYLSRDQHSTSDYSQYLRATWTLFGLLPNTYPPPGAQGYATFGDTQRNFYEEIRLASKNPNARLTWTAGAFYSHLSENIPENIYDPTLDAEVQAFTDGAAAVCDPTVPALACPGGLIYYGPLDKVEDKQLAVFGELTYKITDTFKATLGLRYSKLDFTGSLYEYGPFLGAATPLGGESSASEKPVTPKAALAWQPNRDNLIYASASKGFRPGGVNPVVADFCSPDLEKLGLPVDPVTGLRQPPPQYNSDSLWSYELGGKNSFLDHRLQLNASVFYIDWSNIQQNVYLPSCGEQFTANPGKAVSRGGDIELLWRPINELLLDLTAAYTDAKFTKTSCVGALTFTGATATSLPCTGTDPASGAAIEGSPVVSKGDRLPGAPWSFTGSAEYTFATARSGHRPYIRVDLQHTSAQSALLPGQNSQNALYDTTIPGLPVTNNLQLRAGMRFSGFDVSLFGNNLANSHPLMFSSRDIAVDTVDNLYFGRGVRPRTIGVTATYRY